MVQNNILALRSKNLEQGNLLNTKQTYTKPRFFTPFARGRAVTWYWHYALWLGWPYLTKKIQSKKPRPSTPPSQSVLAAGKMSS
jgi:hypothetical protein